MDPEDFFKEGNITADGYFYPARGNIVTIRGRIVLVISTEKKNRETSSITVLRLEVL